MFDNLGWGAQKEFEGKRLKACNANILICICIFSCICMRCFIQTSILLGGGLHWRGLAANINL